MEIKSIKVGLGGNYQVGSQTPVAASVRLLDGAATTARLVVIAHDADGQLVRTEGDATPLDRDKEKTLRARFIPGRLTGELIVRIELQDGAAAEKRLRPDAATGASSEPLRSPFRQDITFWGLSGVPTSVFDKLLPNSAPAEAAAKSSADDIPKLIPLNPADFPDNSIDLASVDVLIVAATVPTAETGKPFFSELSARQQRALQEWVEIRGGHLVLSVGSQLAQFQQSELAKWLKLSLETEISLRQLDGLESYSPHPVPLKIDGNIPAIRIGTTTGNVLARSLDGPLLIQLPYGFGRVSFLSVDLQQPAVEKWDGLGHLLRKLVSTDRDQLREIRAPGAQLAKSSVTDLSSQLFSALESLPGVVRLSLWSVMALLGISVLIVGPLDYFIVHRWLKRPHLTWFTLLLWVTLGSAMIVGLSNQLNGTRLRATQLEIVDLDEASRLVRGKSWITVYSPRTTRSRVELTQVAPHLAAEGKIAATAPRVAWVAPAENRIGGLYREGGVQLTQREYRALASANDGSDSSPGYADVPLQVWSTERFGGEWSGQTPPLVESHLVSSELGRLTGTVEHRLAEPITDCLLAYSNRVYIPILRRAQGQGKSDLAPHFVWEIGGGQPVEQRELRSFLTQVYMKEVKRGNLKAVELLDLQTPYDPKRQDLDYIIRMMTFHQASGGRDYTGMRHDVLGSFDLSSHLRLGRAVLLGRLKSAKSAAEWKVGDTVLTDEAGRTYVRIVLPVNREREEEATAIPKED